MLNKIEIHFVCNVEVDLGGKEHHPAILDA